MSDNLLTPDGEHRLREDAIKHFMTKHSGPSETDIDELIRRFREDLKSVRAVATAIDEAAKASLAKEHTRHTLSKDISKLILDKAIHYNKDELLLILSTLLGEGLAAEFL